jgi:hypothetical protein
MKQVVFNLLILGQVILILRQVMGFNTQFVRVLQLGNNALAGQNKIFMISNLTYHHYYQHCKIGIDASLFKKKNF